MDALPGQRRGLFSLLAMYTRKPMVLFPPLTEAQSGGAACPGSHGESVARLLWRPEGLGPQSPRFSAHVAPFSLSLLKSFSAPNYGGDVCGQQGIAVRSPVCPGSHCKQLVTSFQKQFFSVGLVYARDRQGGREGDAF